eukprot:175447-Chlamydomonas_euryale.AAC.1
MSAFKVGGTREGRAGACDGCSCWSGIPCRQHMHASVHRTVQALRAKRKLAHSLLRLLISRLGAGKVTCLQQRRGLNPHLGGPGAEDEGRKKTKDQERGEVVLERPE